MNKERVVGLGRTLLNIGITAGALWLINRFSRQSTLIALDDNVYIRPDIEADDQFW